VYPLPNFFTLRTVAWENGKVRLIDQSKLPEGLHYVKCKNYSEIAEAIKNMVVRGAPAIGVTGAMGMALAALKSKATTKRSLLRDLERAQKVLDGTRPTAVNLSWATRRVLNVARSIEGEPRSIVEAVVEEAKMMADEDLEINRTLGRYGASLLRNGDVVLTHCN
jgi:methylthioribose-1-phosphate isomerase